jgi:predicted unusual protein kinase regulating ubiquinone biosynthesis (AarF/ABC1/UbiB family)
MIQFGCDLARSLFPEFKYGWLADEFNTRLPREIDFRVEADNCNRCRSIFKDDKRVAVPKIYDSLVRYRTLVMSFEKGTPVTHVNELHK